MKKIRWGIIAVVLLPAACRPDGSAGELSTGTVKPNVILCMADDQGWGDTGYNGHPVLKTPTLDEMAAGGLRFERFYSTAPVCSPTRGACLTGRHPYRYGITFANVGCLPKQEVTLAEALKTGGYMTGHFGKWHLGTLTTSIRDSNRGGPGSEPEFAPPWEHGFEVCFSTEAKVPTWDPMKSPPGNELFGTYYWKAPGLRETENLEGDDSRIIMDRAIVFIRKAVQAHRPFLAVIWFHTPHLPVVAGADHRRLYQHLNEDFQHYYGSLTALDEQLGRLRRELRILGIGDDTMLWYCSDNGPEGSEKAPGSTGGLRGRKRSLFEGGIRVPGLLEWPRRIKRPRVIQAPRSTSDYYPTILEVLGIRIENQPQPLDGISLLPLIDGRVSERSVPIGFESAGQLALIDNHFKLIRTGRENPWMLFNLTEDPAETRDLSGEHSRKLASMQKYLLQWQASCRDSGEGRDYLR